ncbi:MAG: ribonuclease P protein component [Kiritimatiellia bacterium]
MTEGPGDDRIRAKLRKSAEYEQVFEHGRKVVARRLVVWVLPRPGAPFRAGLVASRKVGNAVARNRCKRRMRELVRAQLDRLAPGHDLVVIARAGLRDCPWADAVADFELACQRAGILAPPPAG